MTCNMCNAPKYGKVEQRTGFGGGYMERDEIVEYNEREESDDEYDEVRSIYVSSSQQLILRLTLFAMPSFTHTK